MFSCHTYPRSMMVVVLGRMTAYSTSSSSPGPRAPLALLTLIFSAVL